MIIEEETSLDTMVIKRITQDQEDCTRYYKKDIVRQKHATLMHQILPMEGNVKVNVDGSSFGNLGHADCGGLIWDNHGNQLRGFSYYIGIVENLWAKLMGIR